MATLPCDAEGQCMLCRGTPSDEEKLTCVTCGTPWHATCLAAPPVSLSSTVDWLCPDCDFTVLVSSSSSCAPPIRDGLVAKIKEIEADGTLTELEKARRRQELVSGIHADVENEDEDNHDNNNNNNSNNNEVLEILDSNVKCVCCMNLPERPVTAPCGHNTCLRCFQKWIGRGNRTCAHCRATIPQKMASQPRINSSLVAVIRMARIAKSNSQVGPSKVYHFVQNQNRPDKAFTTERAQRKGKANAASGKIFVTVPPDHFGPILAENDPERNQGVLVGECWEDRLECRQWGAHLPHVAGIAGQSKYGAQSVVLSGGYQDDEDHGEWFLYTGSGGRDLSGNKRTNKEQSFDQEFAHYNEALRVSCLKGYPVRVVRSHKEKRSSYAPEKGLRYDGVYRIEKCWLKLGVQGHKVCRYLFVRCDNDPAPWTSDENGDRPRPLPVIEELAQATRISERKEQPSWDFDGEEARWKWKKPPPLSQKSFNAGNSEGRKIVKARKSQNITVRQKLLKEFGCLICKQVMTLPVTTPCAHNFCKACLEAFFAGQALVRERNRGGRTLRTQKNIIKCPACPTDISDFYQNHQVNRQMMDVIESLKRKSEEIDGAREGSDEEGTATGIEENPEETGTGAVSKRAKTGDSQDVSSTKERSENDVEVPAVDAPKMDDGKNDSPTSPLHVGSENELDQP